MRIVTLIENLVEGGTLQGEHGLSIYIESGNQKVLFDTGQSGAFIQNAIKMGIDLSQVDSLVLSHGHYDHTGGLYPFLEMNSKAKIYSKTTLFGHKYRGHQRFIGTPFREELISDRWVMVETATQIADQIMVMPEIEINSQSDTHFNGLFLKQEHGWEPDTFEDELYLAIPQPTKVNIVTACSHRGITNICNAATNYFKLPIGLILGGFHLKDCTVGQYVEITHYLRHLKPEMIGTCHCTGVEKFADLRTECDSPMFYNFTGKEISL